MDVDVGVATHPVDGFVNWYTAPDSVSSLLSRFAPMTILEPSAFVDTDAPKLSLSAPSAIVSLTVVDAAAHPVAGLVNTYAAPVSSTVPLAARAPTTMVFPSPLTDTDPPNWAFAAPPSLGVILTGEFDVAHPAIGLVNTYAASLVLPKNGVPIAPTTMTLPSALTDNDPPNRSFAAPSDTVSFACAADVDHPAVGLVNA